MRTRLRMRRSRASEKFHRTPADAANRARRIPACMQHLVATRTVIGDGDASVLLEIRGNAVRIKRRGMPDLFVPLEAAAEVGRFLVAAGRAA